MSWYLLNILGVGQLLFLNVTIPTISKLNYIVMNCDWKDSSLSSIDAFILKLKLHCDSLGFGMFNDFYKCWEICIGGSRNLSGQ